MPPSFKFTREQIIDAALAIVRQAGAEALTARSLAAQLGASPKPIFGIFSGMEEVRRQVHMAANALYESYIFGDMQKGQYPPYKASGMAYIRFAREERELFKLLFMCDRTENPPVEDREALRPIFSLLQKTLDISEDEAYILHLEMWVYVHGIATMIATGFLAWDEAFISNSMTDLYQGMFLQTKEKKRGSH